MRPIAKLQRQLVLAGRQFELGFRLRLAEVKRCLAGADDFALRNGRAVDDEVMMAAVRRHIAGGLESEIVQPEFDRERAFAARTVLGLYDLNARLRRSEGLRGEGLRADGEREDGGEV